MISALLVLALFSSCRKVNQPASREERTVSHKNDNLDGPYGAGIWNSDTITGLGVILQKYLGMPYKKSSKYQTGIDCSRFTSEVYRKFNKSKLPRTARDQANYGTQVTRSKLRYGDLVFFRIDGKSVAHVGVYIAHNRFIHASLSRGVVIDELNSRYWSKRFHSARRVLSEDSLNKTRRKSSKKSKKK